MSSHTSDPIGDPSPDHLHPDLEHPDLEALSRSHSAIENEYLVIDPSLRDANRQLRDLFGACTHSSTGDWIDLDEDGSAVLHGGLDGVRRLAEKCRRLVADVEAGQWERPTSGPRGIADWVSGLHGYSGDGEPSPHLPTGAQLRHRDSRES